VYDVRVWQICSANSWNFNYCSWSQYLINLLLWFRWKGVGNWSTFTKHYSQDYWSRQEHPKTYKSACHHPNKRFFVRDNFPHNLWRISWVVKTIAYFIASLVWSIDKSINVFSIEQVYSDIWNIVRDWIVYNWRMHTARCVDVRVEYGDLDVFINSVVRNKSTTNNKDTEEDRGE